MGVGLMPPERSVEVSGEHGTRINTAREEVVDVLAEALWTLICTGRVSVSPDDADCGAPTDRRGDHSRRKSSQFIETKGI